MTSVAHKVIAGLRQAQARATSADAAAFYDSGAVLVATAAKFVVPFGIPNAVYQTGREYLREGIWRLPFESTVFEFPDVGNTVIAACAEDDAGSAIVTFFGARSDGMITTGRYIASLSSKHADYLHMSRLIFELAATSADEEYFQQMTRDWAAYIIGAVALLDARGVGVEAVAAPDRLNKHRLKKGKVPLYEHRIIKIGGVSSSGRVVGVGMERASPRMHWRRGHVRTLPSGKKAAVRAALISQGGRGFISHEYEVAAHA